MFTRITPRQWRESIAASVLALACACAESGITDVPSAVATLNVSATSVSMTVGETSQITATPMTSSGRAMSARAVSWSAASPGIATVSGSGVISGVAAGTTTVTARSGTAERRIDVTVLAKPRLALSTNSVAFATSASLNPASQTVNVTNANSGALTGLSIGTIQYSPGQPAGWLAATLNASVAPAIMTIQATSAALPAGTYSATIPVTGANTDNGPQTVSVSLVVTPVYVLSVIGAGDGNGQVSASPTGIAGAINCTITNGIAGGGCSATYASGASVTFTATASPTMTFAGWSGACSGTGSCVVAVGQNATVTARFNRPGFVLTVGGGGTGSGQITAPSAGIDCAITNGVASGACSVTLAQGSTVSLTATPSATSTFTAWGGACAGTATSCTVTLTQNTTVNATFSQQPVGLTIFGSGNGNGQVLSSPTGINCTITGGSAAASGCATTFGRGTSVTLSATPQVGHVFGGWSGAGCTGTIPTCVVTLQAATSITATFSRTGAAPIVATHAADNITSTGGDIHGGVDQDGNPYTVWFEWGTSATLATFSQTGSSGGPTTTCPGTNSCLWGLGLTGLTPGTTYYFRIAANNANGTSRGVIRSFTTTGGGNSAPVIFNLTNTLVGVNSPACAANIGGNDGTLHRLTFSYSDPNGNVTTAGTPVTLGWLFNPGASTGSAPWVVESSTGNGSSGTITIGVCSVFGSATSIVYSVTLRDAGGLASAALSVTMNRPAGANTAPLPTVRRPILGASRSNR